MTGNNDSAAKGPSEPSVTVMSVSDYNRILRAYVEAMKMATLSGLTKDPIAHMAMVATARILAEQEIQREMN